MCASFCVLSSRLAPVSPRAAFCLPGIWKFVRPAGMKRLRTSLMAVGIILAMASIAQAGSLGRQLVDLESHIKWSAVDSAWRGLRDSWVRTTSDCDEAACVAAQMLKLEANVKWQAVDKAWRERRPGWLNDCKGATTEPEVAKLLLEFEANVRWRAVDDGWKTRRESWVSELKGE